MPAKGTSLLETVTAMALLAIMMSAIAALLMAEQSLQGQYRQRLLAWQVLTELNRRWQLNPSASASYLQALSTSAWPTVASADRCAEGPCSPVERAAADVHWAQSQLFRLANRRWQVQRCPTSSGDCLLFAWGQTDACVHTGYRGKQCLWLELPP